MDRSKVKLVRQSKYIYAFSKYSCHVFPFGFVFTSYSICLWISRMQSDRNVEITEHILNYSKTTNGNDLMSCCVAWACVGIPHRNKFTRFTISTVNTFQLIDGMSISRAILLWYWVGILFQKSESVHLKDRSNRFVVLNVSLFFSFISVFIISIF